MHSHSPWPPVLSLFLHCALLVPSQLHEVLVMLFKNRPELAPVLLEQALRIELPRYEEVRLDSAELTDVVPAEYKAQPIPMGPGATLRPLVVGPEGVPVVKDPGLAARFPELAILSVMAHGRGEATAALEIARTAAEAAIQLDSETQALYLDLIESALGEAARKAFAMLPQDHQFQGPTYLRVKAEGKAEGEAAGKADAVLVALEARGIAIRGEQRERIAQCRDLERLEQWIRKAMTLSEASELFEE